MDKQHILDEIRRAAVANNGVALGRVRFFQETGIRETDWSGKYWPRWSAAIEEAGFAPRQLQGKSDRATVLQKLAGLTRKLGKFPTIAEMKLERRNDSEFPSHGSLSLVRLEDRLKELREYCRSTSGYEDIEKILSSETRPAKQMDLPEEDIGSVQYGYVYLIHSAKRYKIGYSKAVLNRASVVSNLSPEGGEIIHLIRTDDMRGIESYWHSRFAEKRGNGEWFALSSADIAAFKRRKFM